MTFIKLNQADLDSPRRELSNGGLKSVVTLLVCWQINFLLARNERPIHLYVHLLIKGSIFRQEMAIIVFTIPV